MNIVTGEELHLLTTPEKSRWQLGQLMDYLENQPEDRPAVCTLYGLRRTGKTTLLLQGIKELLRQGTDPETIGYLTGKKGDCFDDLILELDSRRDLKYIFIDEVGFFGDFLRGGSYLYDTLVRLRGQKVVVAGTNLLALYLASKNTLYDRCRIIPMPYLSFYEHSAFVLGKESPDREDLMWYLREGGLFDPPVDVADYVQTSIVNSIVELFDTEMESEVFVWLKPQSEHVDWKGYVNTILLLSSNYVSSKSLTKTPPLREDLEALDGQVTRQVVRDFREYFSLRRQDRDFRMKRTETVALLDFLVHCGVINVLPNLYEDAEPYKCYVAAPFLRYHFTDKLRAMSRAQSVREDTALFGGLLEAAVVGEYREGHPGTALAFARTHYPQGSEHVAEIDLLDLGRKRGYEVKLTRARDTTGAALLENAPELAGFALEVLDAGNHVDRLLSWGRRHYPGNGLEQTVSDTDQSPPLSL